MDKIKNTIDIKMLKPFGSTISEQALPDNLVKDFLTELKRIRALPPKERQRYSVAHKLVGSVESEYMVTPEVLLKYKDSFFDVCIAKYCQIIYPDFKAQRIVVNLAWYVVQKINQFNSIHQHTNHTAFEQKHPQISCIGYLQIPKMIPLECAKSHHDISGKIEFFEGSENYFSSSVWRKNPTLKTFLIFPSHLAHFVAPMNSDDPDAEKISFSLNAVVEFAKANEKEN